MKPRLPAAFTVMFFFLLLSQRSYAQVTITISDADFRDAAVHQDNRVGREFVANTNYATYPRLTSTAWTTSSVKTYARTLMYFNLQAIPRGSTIQSATLYLYSDPTVTSSSAADGNSQLNGSNAIYLDKLLGEWNLSTVTWNNQPATTTVGRISVGATTTTTENRQVNITSMVQDWVTDPLTNNGLKMSLQTEVAYRSRNYASTNHANTSIRPKVVITYTVPQTTIDCTAAEPTEEDYVKTPWYGSETFLTNFDDSLTQVFNNPAQQAVGDVESPWLRVRIRLWVYQISAGNPGGANPGANFPNESRIQLMMDNLNNAARNNGVKLRFYLGGVTFVDRESALNPGDFFEQKTIADTYRDLNAVNIHIVDQLDGAQGLYNMGYNAVFIRRSSGTTQQLATSFTHETGHYFGLWHTHNFAGKTCFREPVTRGVKFTLCPNPTGPSKRCLFTGDLLCDTDADPDMSAKGTYDGTVCTWNANGLTDQYGDVYHPSSRNFMAYGNRDTNSLCRSSFSDGQKKVMHFFAFKRQFRPDWHLSEANKFDRFEPDDADIAFRELPFGVNQSHTFHTSGRTDNVDWLRFQYPVTGSLNNYQLLVTQVDASAVGAVNFYVQNVPANTAGARLNGITSSTSGNIVTYTIPCNLLTPGSFYLIELPRGTGGTGDYNVELRANQVTTASISGPSTVCNTNATFTVTNAPVGATINWTNSPNMTYVSGQGTSTYTVVKNTSGNGTIGVSFTGTCGSSNATQMAVRVGGYSSSDYPVFGPTTLCTNTFATYNTNTLIGATNYSWFWPSGWSVTGQGSPSISITTGYSSTTGTVGVRVANACDAGGSPGTLLVYVLSCGQFSVGITPNPVTSQFTVEILDGEGNKNANIDGVQLLDGDGRLVRESKSISRKVQVDTQGLRKGFYYVKTSIAGNVSTTRIVIE